MMDEKEDFKEKANKLVDKNSLMYAVVAIVIPFGCFAMSVYLFVRYVKAKKLSGKSEEEETKEQ